jgi:hypothetical protein
MTDLARLRRRLLGVLAGLGAAGLLGAAGRAPPLPPPADPATVLAQALAAALADGSSAALILFIARYPDEPLTGTARAALAARRRPDPRIPAGPDGAVIAAFDRARLAGPAALAAFARAYPNHPLGAEALRPDWR